MQLHATLTQKPTCCRYEAALTLLSYFFYSFLPVGLQVASLDREDGHVYDVVAPHVQQTHFHKYRIVLPKQDS
jgi:hypothetical protein